MPLAVYQLLEGGNSDAALTLSIVLLIISIVVLASVGRHAFAR